MRRISEHNHHENGRHLSFEPHTRDAPAEPGHGFAETHNSSAGLTLSRNGRHFGCEPHLNAGPPYYNTVAKMRMTPRTGLRPPSPAIPALKPIPVVPGSPIPQNGRQFCSETQIGVATVVPDHQATEAQLMRAGLVPFKEEPQ